MTQQEALTRLSSLCQAEKDPALSGDELLDLLTRFASVFAFSSGRAFSKGQKVVASSASLTSTGVVYLCVQGGVSSSEPSVWPTSTGCRVQTGGAVFSYLGYYDGCQWDLMNAKREGIRMHLEKAADRVNISGKTQTMQDQQVVDNWERVLKQCGPAMFIG